MNMQFKPQQKAQKNPFAPDASLFMHSEQVSQKNVDAVMQCFAKQLETESRLQFSSN